MKKLNDLKQSCDKILSSGASIKIKKELLQGIIGELKSMHAVTKVQNAEGSLSSYMKFDQTDTNFTAFSHLSLNSNVSSVNSDILPSSAVEGVSEQQLQMKILQKQRIKIMLNEQIENYEDDYFHFQKILLTKKEYNENLDDQIAKRSYEISKKSCLKSATPTAAEEKKTLSYRFKSFFLL